MSSTTRWDSAATAGVGVLEATVTSPDNSSESNLSPMFFTASMVSTTGGVGVHGMTVSDDPLLVWDLLLLVLEYLE